MVEKTTSVYIIRHCEAVGNVDRIFQGHTDGDITEKGRLQLEKLKERCREISFDAVYTSPLKRAVETAKAANFYSKAPLITEKNLMEINGGDMEGKKWDDLPLLFPEHFPVWKTNFAAFSAPNGESVHDVYHRVKKCITAAVDTHRGKNIGIVSHGGAIYTFISYIKGYKPEAIGNLEHWVDNTSVTRVDFCGNDCKLVYFNDCAHINASPDTAARMQLW